MTQNTLELSPDEVRRLLKRGRGKRAFLQKFHAAKERRLSEGIFAARIPLGYSQSTYGKEKVMSIDPKEAYHVLAIFVTTALSRIYSSSYGKFSHKDIHQEFLEYFDPESVREKVVDGSFIVAILKRRTYRGELHYRGKKHGECPAIVPPILFDLVQDCLRVVSKPGTRTPNWKEKRRELLSETYYDALGKSRAWIDTDRHKITKATDTLEYFGIHVDDLYSLFTFKTSLTRGVPAKQKRRNFKVVEEYSLWK